MTTAKVLVDDDEPQLRRALDINLRIRDYEVVLAGTDEAEKVLALDAGATTMSPSRSVSTSCSHAYVQRCDVRR